MPNQYTAWPPSRNTSGGGGADALAIYRDDTQPPTQDISWAGFGLYDLGFLESGSANVADADFLRLSNSDAIAWRNLANSGNNLLRLSGNALVYDYGTFVLGDPTQASQTAAINMPYGGSIGWRDSGNTFDLKLFSIGTGLILQANVGQTKLEVRGTVGAEDYFYRGTFFDPYAGQGVIRLQNTDGIFWRNAANSGEFGLSLNASDIFQMGAALDLSAAASGSTVGGLRLANNQAVGWRNAADSANKTLKVDASDNFSIDSNLVFSAQDDIGIFPGTANSPEFLTLKPTGAMNIGSPGGGITWGQAVSAYTSGVNSAYSFYAGALYDPGAVVDYYFHQVVIDDTTAANGRNIAGMRINLADGWNPGASTASGVDARVDIHQTADAIAFESGRGVASLRGISGQNAVTPGLFLSGLMSYANNATFCAGGLFAAGNSTDNNNHFGMASYSIAGGAGKSVAGLFMVKDVAPGNNTTATLFPPSVRLNSAIVASNSTTTADLLTLLDNTTQVVRVIDGGTLELLTNASLASTADTVQLGAYDIAAGERTLALSTEEPVNADVALVSTHSLIIRINGANYKLMLVSA